MSRLQCVMLSPLFINLLYCLWPGTPGSCSEWVLAANCLGQRPFVRFFLQKGLVSEWHC